MAHIYQLLLEESAGLREASADLIAARVSDIGKQHFLKIGVSTNTSNTPPSRITPVTT